MLVAKGSTKTGNVERRNVEHLNRKPGTPEQKIWKAGTEYPERWNRKLGTHFLTLLMSFKLR